MNTSPVNAYVDVNYNAMNYIPLVIEINNIHKFHKPALLLTASSFPLAGCPSSELNHVC